MKLNKIESSKLWIDEIQAYNIIACQKSKNNYKT